MQRGIGLGVALLITGCAPTNISELAKALSGDQASVCVTITTIYGTAKAARSGLLNGTVNCSADGMAIKAAVPEASQVGVPLTIVPQLSIGPPALVPPPTRPAPAPRVTPQAAPASPREGLLSIQWTPPEDGPGSLSDAAVLEILRTVGALHRGAP